MTANSKKYRALVIDDDKEMRLSLIHLLESAHWHVDAISSAVGAEEIINTTLPDVILTDVRMPKRTGLDLLSDLAFGVAPPVVLISAHGDIPMAVDAIQRGAYSFLEKPFDPRRLLTVLDHAAEQHRLQENTTRLKARLADLSGLNRIFIGQAEIVEIVREQVLDFSVAKGSILILGETGTGKELVAKALHDLSPKAEQAFVAINCAAVPVADFEEVMFGRKGVLSGVFSKADKGTLFLDEITSAPLEIQAKLLRFLESQQFSVLGSDTINQVDIRFIAAANEDPQLAIVEGRLREDLYYRLNGLVLRLPSLREHKDDIPLLFQHFLSEFARLYEVSLSPQTADDISALMSHTWPGNVRELRSLAERCMLSSRRGHGGAAHALQGRDNLTETPENLRGAVAAFERTLIGNAIRAHKGKMDLVADALGIGRRTLNEKIVKLGLDKESLL